MSIEERLNIYSRIDQLIRLKVPGKSCDLAERLEVSRSTFYRCIDEMKGLGAPIIFDEVNERYIYNKPGEFIFGFLSDEEKHSISGGFINTIKNYFTSLKF